MKTSMWTAILLGLLMVPGAAQQQATSLAQAQAQASPSQSRIGFVASPGDNSVYMVDSVTFDLLPSTAGAPNPIVVAGSAPNFVLSIPSRNRVYVSNFNGTVSIIDSVSRTLLSTVGVQNPATGSAFGGMVLSPDGNRLFVAGLNGAAAESGVFQLDLNSPTVLTYKGGRPTLQGNPAQDVDVVPASVVGGSGNGDGRFYFTVPGENVIGVLNGAGTFLTSIAPPAGTNVPTRLEKSPDSSFLVAGCTSLNNAGLRLIRIVPQTSGETTDFVEVPFFPVQTSGPTIRDVTFNSRGTSAPFTVYAGGIGNTTFFVHELTVSPTGVATDVTETPFFQDWGGQVTYDPDVNRVFASNETGGPDFATIDLNGTPPYGSFSRTATGAINVQKVAFTLGSGPTVDYVNPSAGPASAPPQIRIQGSGFKSGAVAHLLSQFRQIPEDIPATTTTVVNSTTILATFPPIPPNSGPPPAVLPTMYDVAVVNPDGQQSALRNYFQTLDSPPAPAAPFPVLLPALIDGYAMISFPQYATVGDLRAALNAQVGYYNPALYRLFMYDRGQYIELTQVNLSTDLMGKGLFAVSRFGPFVTLPSPDVYANTGGTRVVSITPGWNLVSYPFAGGGSGDFSGVQLSQYRDLSFSQTAVTSGLIHPNIFEFIGGAYSIVSSPMVPGQAYWVYNLTSGPLYLQFQGFSPKRRAGAKVAPVAPLSPPPPPGAVIGENMGCGFTGLEALLAGLAASAFRRLRSRRKLAA